MRIGLGPVFAYEWLTTSRNWRVYALRCLFGLGLLVMLCLVWSSMSSARQQALQSGTTNIRQQAEVGRGFSAVIIATGISLMLLIAPAAAASTICMDKARGTLAHVMATDLSDAEIVLGKLAARLVPCLGLVVSALGVMALVTLMGGVDPVSLTGAMMVLLGVTVLGCTLALTISVWAGKTHEVVMASYLILSAWLLFYPFWFMLSHMGLGIGRPPEWLQYAHPYWLALDVQPGQVPLHRHVYFLLACLGLSAGMAAMAIFRLRAVAIHQMNRPAGARKARRRARLAAAEGGAMAEPPRRRWRFRLLPAPTLDGNPVLWREWQRANPSRWSRFIWYTYAAGSIGFTTFGFYLIASYSATNVRGGAEVAMVAINGFMVSLGLLLMSVSAATSLAEERVRGSLDVLLTTTLSTRSIVWGKWWAAFRRMSVLAVLPAILALSAAYFTPIGVRGWAPPRPPDPTRWLVVPLIVGLTLSYGAAITSFGLVMATWIARLDRAVMATVAVYLLMAIGVPIVAAFLSPGNDVHGPGAACASPFMGIAYTGAMMMESNINRMGMDRWGPQIAWATFWILMNLTFAAALLKLEFSRFNTKLGRIPDEGLPPRPAPPRAAVVAKEEPVLV